MTAEARFAQTPPAQDARPRPALAAAHVIASVSDMGAGPSYSVTALAAAQARAGADVRLLTVKGWRDSGEAPRAAASVPTVSYDWDYRGVPGLSSACVSGGLRRGLFDAARDEGILHAHGLWLAPNLYPAWAVKHGRAKLVVSPRGMLGAEALEYSSKAKAVLWAVFQRRALAAAGCLHATSEDERVAIRAAGLSGPVATIPNGIDLPPPWPANAEPSSTVLALGRIHPKKGLDQLIRAWAAVEARHPLWRLRIVGPAELGHDLELKALAASLGLQRVVIEGPAFGDAKAAAYRDAALFVLSTRNENFAMTVAEALAHGVPVISTKGAPWAGLETERCGWWVDGDPEAIAAALNSALTTPSAARRAMGQRGRAWMERDFGWSRVAADMLDVYRWLCQGGERPATVRLD